MCYTVTNVHYVPLVTQHIFKRYLFEIRYFLYISTQTLTDDSSLIFTNAHKTRLSETKIKNRLYENKIDYLVFPMFYMPLTCDLLLLSYINS